MASADKREIEQRVSGILAQMTIEEKVDYIGGIKEFFIRGIPRLGVPEIKTSDGPTGCRNYGLSTAYAATIMLAASWNPQLASAVGAAMVRDCRARGVHILLAPGMNIYRSPLCGRNFEYFGEDPFLAARFVVPLIKGIQAGGVLACAKHYACNNQEYDRHHTSSEVGPRTLREIYLPAFRAAIQDAKAATVMNGYNLVNGIHCTHHDDLNNQILKKEWGFDGVLMSDWASTYDAIEPFNGGLDLEMPHAKWMNRQNLLPALAEGRISEKTLDDKVRRLLRMIIRNGFMDRPPMGQAIPLYDPASVRVALQEAREGIVLLKNERSTLPLDRKKLKKIAVIGPNAHPAVWGGGGSALTYPFRSTSVLDALTAKLGDDIEVFYERGLPSENQPELFRNSFYHCKRPDGTEEAGLWAEYFESRDLSGAAKITRVDPLVNFDWGSARPDFLPGNGFSIRWTGWIEPGTSGLYVLATRCDDGMRVWLDDEKIIDDWSQHAARVIAVERTLEAGRKYSLKVEYYDVGGHCTAQFGWGQIAQPTQDAAVMLAKSVDAVVLCIGWNADSEGEGGDRPFALPEAQEKMVRAVSTANPNTVALLFSGGALATEAWRDRIPAMLHAWLPGQEGGTAIAEVLLGEINPSGKLPISFEKKAEDHPSFNYYQAIDKKTFYREGIFIGYRGFDRNAVEPLFPFGHGLSFTSFEYSNVQVSPEAAIGKKIKVIFDIANTGGRTGAEVAQLYIGKVDGSAVDRPIRELKGFKRVSLGKGKKKTVTLGIDVNDLAYWDVASDRFVVEPGAYEISIGASSRDLRLTSRFNISAG